MKWAMSVAAALSILVVNLHAQQPIASAHGTRLVAGCLQAGEASETYRLTNASPRIDATEPAGQPVGTSGERVEYDVAVDTGLDRSGPPIDLKAHVGQQVQLTVRPVEPTAAPAARLSFNMPPSAASTVRLKPDTTYIAGHYVDVERHSAVWPWPGRPEARIMKAFTGVCRVA